MSIGQRIKSARKLKKVSQVNLANAINVSKQTLYKYENDIITNIPSDKIEAISRFLGISPAYIMGWDDSPRPYFSAEEKGLVLSDIEKDLIVAYRKMITMQSAVNTLLGLKPPPEKK